MLETILTKCNNRFNAHNCEENCSLCTYTGYCPHDCEKCLDYIHTPTHAPCDAPNRKYDCSNMADFYTCKYSCRYTSEMIYAFQRLIDLQHKTKLKVLSFGCGPCTDLFALNYLKKNNELFYDKLEYRGVDYSKDVWKNIHTDIKELQTNSISIKFFYKDACEFINTIAEGAWIPDLVVFQYVMSDMRKHSDAQAVTLFIHTFAQFANEYMPSKSYIILNDGNFGINYGGGREYFDRLYRLLDDSFIMYKGRFHNENSRSTYYPRGFPYGDDSDGEFPNNRNFFNLSRWDKYSPFNTCASAQMLIKKEG